jgi:hypothetical protein
LKTSSTGDLDVASAGSIVANTTTPLVTLDSNNKVTVEGALTSKNTDNATGVLILGGNTGSFTSTGSIVVGEDYVAKDTANSDAILEAPFAQGTGRAGLRLTGTSAFNGDISLGGTGLSVQGNNSYGVSIEGPLNGSLTTLAPVTLVGDNGVAIRTLGPVSGSVTLGSTVSASGAGARAVDIEAPVAGALKIYGAVSASAYATTTRATVSTALAKIQATPLDVQQGGAAVTVGSSVAGGVFVAAAPSGTVSGTLADLDGDGVTDGVEGTGSIISYGAAPALLLGSAGQTVTLGAFGTGDNGYGLIVRGAITGSGIYDGVSATGLQIGAGGSVNIAGGVRVVGSIAADTYEANATAVHVLGGSVAPVFRNEGVLSAVVSDSALTPGLGSASAYGLQIEAGASVGSLLNSGTVTASTIGNTGAAVAVSDASGSLANIVNQGVISALRTSTDSSVAVTGSNIALDLRANTSGVTLVQQLNPNPNTTYGSTSGTTDTATTSVTATTPSITGDVLLGSGPNSVSLLAGTLTGALDLGSNTASLTLDNAAAYYGSLRYSGSSLALRVTNGSLTEITPSTLKLSSLTVGSSGVLNLAIDPVGGKTTLLQVSGAASFLAGAKIGVNLTSAVNSAQTFTLVTSPQLSVGESDAALLASSSFLVTATLHSDPGAGVITVNLTPRSPADLGLNSSEGSALAQIVNGAGGDSAVSAALLAQQDSTGFAKLYRQLLPEHGDGTFLALSQATRNIADLSTEHNALFAPGATEGGLWMQQFLLGVRQQRDVAQASETGGFGLVGGLETSDSNLGAFGISAAYVNASSSDPDLPGGSTTFSQLEGGLNWKTGLGPIEISARGGGGYLWGVTRRVFQADATSTTAAVARTTKGTWNGWTVDGRLSASYRMDFKHLFIQPTVKLDYIRLDQDAYTERFGGAALNLAVAKRSGDEASVTGSVLFGGKLGDTGALRPLLEIGVRDVFHGDAGSVTAAYESGGSSFTLVPNTITGAGGLAKLGMRYTGQTFDVELAAKAEAFNRYQEGDLRVAVSTRF